MRNVWLIARREYLERVRTRAFLISTLLIPAALYAMIGLSAKRSASGGGGPRRFVLVTQDPQLVALIQQRLDASAAAEPNSGAQAQQVPPRFELSADSVTTDAERDDLRRRASAGEIDGYIWLTNDAIASGTVSYAARQATDFIEVAALERATSSAIARQRLLAAGVPPDELEAALTPVRFSTLKLEGGKESRMNEESAILVAVVAVMMLFVTVTMYGVMVLRAVVDEKSSRVMEVMLASATPKQMMAGKVLGVGAVGLSQLGIWSIAAAIYGTPGLVMASVLGFTIPKEILIGLPVFFVLGYVLYSACFAALGATVNSEQEAQQLQMIVMLPLILASSFMWEVIRHPDSATSIFLSLFPFTSPVLMFMRMAVATPPLWQVLLCVALLIATVYLVISICARIYRVGILMYGKRPTLPEIIKWLRYA